jgi:serine/threonine protein kinase
MRLATGTVLDDRFQIISFLGAGSFGEVYQATQLIFGKRFREVALKLFAANRVSTANVDDIFNDAITLIGLQEENPSAEVSRRLVQIYDMGVLKAPEQRAFMSMKLVRGKQTLDTAVQQFSATGGGMPVALSLRYLRQLLVPLAWMHALDPAIVHGDLKPDNVLLNEKSEVILTDFGLAARMPISSMGGAIAYQAPEKLLGADAGTASDIYAVGLIWYEMLTGRHPFEDVGLEAKAAGDDKGFVRAHQAARKWPMRAAREGDDPHKPERIRPASELNEEFKDHPQLEALLSGCLAYEQSKRFSNAALLLMQVERYLKNGVLEMGELATVIQAPEAEDVEAELGQKSAEASLRDAETLLAQGKSQRALETVEGVMKGSPNLLPAILLKARCLAGVKRTEEAMQIWAEARRLAPRDPAVYEAQAEIYQAEGKRGMAETARVNANRLRIEAASTVRRRF